MNRTDDLIIDDDDWDDEPYQTGYRPGLIGTLIILLLILSLLISLAWPLIPSGYSRPTPTPRFWEEQTAQIEFCNTEMHETSTKIHRENRFSEVLCGRSATALAVAPV